MARSAEELIDELVVTIGITAELLGTNLSEPAALAFAQRMQQYDHDQVIAALEMCQTDCKGRLTPHEVLSRLPDGRPSVEEAWSLLAWDEESTTVLPIEAEIAQGIARPLMKISRADAKTAFKDAYTRLVNENRQAGKKPIWSISEGYDKQGREDVIKQAVAAGKLSIAAAEARGIYIDPPKRLQIEDVPEEVRAQIMGSPLRGLLQIEE